MAASWRHARSASATPPLPSQVTPRTQAAALDRRRLSCRIDARGRVLSAAGDAPPALFGFDPASVVGAGVGDFVDLFAGLPESGGKGGRDMEHVLEGLARRCAGGGRRLPAFLMLLLACTQGQQRVIPGVYVWYRSV